METPQKIASTDRTDSTEKYPLNSVESVEKILFILVGVEFHMGTPQQPFGDSAKLVDNPGALHPKYSTVSGK